MKLVDSGATQSYSSVNRGENLVKRAYWTLFLCLLGTLFVLALPPVDVPDTAFNEMDTPMNIAHPALPRVNLAAPATESAPMADPIVSFDGKKYGSKQNELDVPPSHSPDLQPVLCTFLI